jgi:hypothetical protein
LRAAAAPLPSRAAWRRVHGLRGRSRRPRARCGRRAPARAPAPRRRRCKVRPLHPGPPARMSHMNLRIFHRRPRGHLRKTSAALRQIIDLTEVEVSRSGDFPRWPVGRVTTRKGRLVHVLLGRDAPIVRSQGPAIHRLGRPSHPVETDRLGAATQDVVSLVREPLGEVIAIFRMQGGDEGVADQHRGVERPAVCFDTTGTAPRRPRP